MVVGFTTTFAISVYHHCSCEFESRSGELYSIHYVIKFVSYLRQVGGFLRVLRFPPPILLLLLPECGHHQFVDYSATFWMRMQIYTLSFIFFLLKCFTYIYSVLRVQKKLRIGIFFLLYSVYSNITTIYI